MMFCKAEISCRFLNEDFYEVTIITHANLIHKSLNELIEFDGHFTLRLHFYFSNHMFFRH